jgi:hypothetical protein
VKRRRKPAAAFEYGHFAWQTGWVFALRSAELWTEPAKAQSRLARYALEKQKAFAIGAVRAGAAAMGGAGPEAVIRAALAPSRQRVRANARKLAKGAGGG